MTREDQFVLVVQLLAQQADARTGETFAPEVVAYACTQALPPPDPAWPPAEDVLRLAREYVTWMYSRTIVAGAKPAWIIAPHAY